MNTCVDSILWNVEIFEYLVRIKTPLLGRGYYYSPKGTYQKYTIWLFYGFTI